MDYPPWQSATEPVGDYTPRKPWESALYRIIYNYRDDFQTHYSELFEESYGFLRDEVTDAFDRYLNCGILRHGAARACCPDCNHSILIAFSCKRRGVCPSCAAKRAAIFAEHLPTQVLLPHSYRHLVFSLPKRLRVYFRYDRLLFRYLYQAAWQTWSEYVGEGTAAVLALHTSGDLLNWHPHIHALCLNGAVDEQNSFSELTDIDEELLCERFANKVFNFLFDLGYIDDDVISNMKSWQHSGFNVYAAPPIEPDDENARLFLARYLKKTPLAGNRISLDESGLEPTVVYRNPADTETREFSPLEFLAELSLHVPDTFEQRGFIKHRLLRY